MFCLCRKCVLTSHTGECRHTTDEKRAPTGTWVLDEVRLAVEKGYRILEIYDLNEYRATRYDHETREGGPFADYMDTFLKLKDQASD